MEILYKFAKEKHYNIKIISYTPSKNKCVIIRKFINGMKDILKLDKNGTSGTIEHFDERGKFISKIKRTPEEVYEVFNKMVKG